MSSILVLDDQATERELLSIVLRHAGHTVIEAPSGAQALDLVRAQRPDLIIADLMMPGMHGYDFMRELRVDPAVGDTKVVFCTAAYDEEEVREVAQSCGVWQVLVKPCEPEEIICVVGEILAAGSNSAARILSQSFDREAALVVNAKLIQKVDELAALNREQQGLHEELRRAHRATAESLVLLEVLQQSAPVGFGFVDREFRVRRLNETLATINGRPQEEQLGRTMAEVLPQTWPEIEPMYRYVLDTGEPLIDQEMQGEVSSSPGETRHWRASYYPVRTGDELIGIGVVVVDLTELKGALTQAVEASRLKSEFMRNMSHEIRTPLSGAVKMTDLLRHTALDSLQREYADTLAESYRALRAVVDDILDYSKLEGKHLVLDSAAFDLRKAVAEVCALDGQLARTRGLEIRQSVGIDVPEIVVGDEHRVRQILSKLLANAVKFTAAGEITVGVGGGGGKTVRFEVTDDGVGIEENFAAGLFDAFVQGDGSTTRKYGGTGIGLTIARELVQLMNGEIGASSRETGGSVFWFTAELPGAAQANGRTHANPQHAALTLGNKGAGGVAPGPLVLVVEDDPVNRAVAQIILRRRGLRTEVAHDGREAVEMAGAVAYDAIFMDCKMPNMDGYEATRCIRIAERGRRVPIIAMTAGAMSGDRERCLASGMDDYLSKPVQPEALDAGVERWLHQSDAALEPLA